MSFSCMLFFHIRTYFTKAMWVRTTHIDEVEILAIPSFSQFFNDKAKDIIPMLPIIAFT